MNQPSGSPTSLATLPAALESRVRFTLRGMLAGMMATSVFLAAAAPWSRQLTAEQRQAFLLLSCNVVIGAVATAVFSCVQRVRVERRAGAARYRLASSISTSGAIFAAGAALFWSGSLVTYAFATVSFINARPQRMVFDFTAVQFGILLSASRTWNVVENGVSGTVRFGRRARLQLPAVQVDSRLSLGNEQSQSPGGEFWPQHRHLTGGTGR